MSEHETATSPAAELVAVVEDLMERQRQILGAFVATTHPLKNDVQAVLLGLRGVVTKLRNGAAGVTTTAAPSIENAELRDLIADELGRHLPSATTGAEANVHEALYFGLVSVVAPVLEGLRAEREQLKEQKGAGWNAALDGSNHAAGLAAQIDRQRETIARLTREHDQAVKDWGHNDEQVRADSERLADENADLRAKVERLTGYLSSIGGTIDAWEITDVSRPSVSDQTSQPISLPRAHQIAQEIAEEAEARRSALAEREAASDQTPATPPHAFSRCNWWMDTRQCTEDAVHDGLCARHLQESHDPATAPSSVQGDTMPGEGDQS